MSDTDPAADWYADPFGRHEVRYWDGSNWTDHVATGGVEATDAPVHHQPAVTPKPTWRGDGTVLGEPLLVVSQRAEVVRANTEYAIYDISGRQLGAVRQLGTRVTSKMNASLGPIERFMTRRYLIIDMAGTVLLRAARPSGFGRARLVVRGATGGEIGRILRGATGKAMASFVVAGRRVGRVVLTDAGQETFAVINSDDDEVARIVSGPTAGGSAFGAIDRQLLEVHQPLDDPMRALTIAAALLTDPVIPTPADNGDGSDET